MGNLTSGLLDGIQKYMDRIFCINTDKKRLTYLDRPVHLGLNVIKDYEVYEKQPLNYIRIKMLF